MTLIQTLMTDYFKKEKKRVFGYNSETESWHCLVCGVDMGKMNPRQLCRKTYCENE
jgi:hypothetical protein